MRFVEGVSVADLVHSQPFEVHFRSCVEHAIARHPSLREPVDAVVYEQGLNGIVGLVAVSRVSQPLTLDVHKVPANQIMNVLYLDAIQAIESRCAPKLLAQAAQQFALQQHTAITAIGYADRGDAARNSAAHHAIMQYFRARNAAPVQEQRVADVCYVVHR